MPSVSARWRSTRVCTPMLAWSMPGQPQHVEAAHAGAAGQRVHHRLLERVADVQAAGDVRRRNHQRERRFLARVVGGEVAALDPALVQRRPLPLPARTGSAGRARVAAGVVHDPEFRDRARADNRVWRCTRRPTSPRSQALLAAALADDPVANTVYSSILTGARPRTAPRAGRRTRRAIHSCSRRGRRRTRRSR